jgi:hypothetical protein
MSNLYVPPCPTTCSGSVAAVDFDDCAPVFHWGEIARVYIGPTTIMSFLDVSSITEWNSVLDDDDADHIRQLTTLGDMPEAENTEVPASGDRVAIGFKKFTVNFQIDETNDTNYGFHQMLECGGKFKFWFETSDGMLYGGNDGIEASIKTNQVVPAERTAIVKIMGVATWKSLHSPARCVSPLY